MISKQAKLNGMKCINIFDQLKIDNTSQTQITPVLS